MFRNTAAFLTATGAATSLMAAGLSPAQAAVEPKPVPAAAPVTAAEDLLSPQEKVTFTKLSDNEVLRRKDPGEGSHSYRFTTTTAYWSVLAVDPTAKLAPDTDVYVDKDQEEKVADLGFGLQPGRFDFVAIDSNHRPVETYYPRLTTYDGHGKYDIEFAQGAHVAGDGFQLVDMGDDAVATVRDTYLEAGVNYRFVLSPTSSKMNGSLFLMDSDPDVPTSWVEESIYAADKTKGVAGTATVLDYTPETTDWFGLVIVSEGASGDFQLHRITF